MGAGKFFRKVWLGLQVAEPYINIAASLVPGGGPVALALKAFSALITRAEVEYPAQGSGVQKAEFFTLQGMKVAEIITGKNIDSPEGRALLDEYASAEVMVRNGTAQLQIVIQKFHDYIDSAKAPAKDDTTS